MQTGDEQYQASSHHSKEIDDKYANSFENYIKCNFIIIKNKLNVVLDVF